MTYKGLRDAYRYAGETSNVYNTLILTRHLMQWAKEGFAIKVNGHQIGQTDSGGSYVILKRTWHDGDTIELALRAKLRLERMSNDESKAVIMKGPIILAGKIGGEIIFPYAHD